MSGFISRGVKGAPGPQGPAGTVTVLRTVTGSPGSDASVVNEGTSTNARLVFTVPQGAQGVQGETGQTGQQGPQGPAGTIAVARTITGEPGTNASVVNEGTSEAASLVFTIPKGLQGETGPVGPQGLTGPRGQPGAIPDGVADLIWSDAFGFAVSEGVSKLTVPTWAQSMSVAATQPTNVPISIGAVGSSFYRDETLHSFLGFGSDDARRVARGAPYTEYGTEVTVSTSAQLTSPSVTLAGLSGSKRDATSLQLKWGTVVLATAPPASADVNLTGGTVTAGDYGVTGGQASLAYRYAATWGSVSKSVSLQAQTLAINLGIPDGAYTGTISGYHYLCLPAYSVLWLNDIYTEEWSAWVTLTTRSLVGKSIVLVPWSVSGGFTVNNGSVNVSVAAATVTGTVPLYVTASQTYYDDMTGTAYDGAYVLSGNYVFYSTREARPAWSYNVRCQYGSVVTSVNLSV